MKHAEMLHDPECMARGEELATLYIDGLNHLRADAPTEAEYTHNYKRDIKNLIQNAVAHDGLDDGAFTELGRSVVMTYRTMKAMQAWRDHEEVGSPEWHVAFQPAHDFLNRYAGKPIIAEDAQFGITSFTLFGRHSILNFSAAS